MTENLHLESVIIGVLLGVILVLIVDTFSPKQTNRYMFIVKTPTEVPED